MRAIDPSPRRWTSAVAAALAALLPAFVAGAAPTDGLDPGEHGRVAEVVDGDTVVLDGGPSVRLVGLQAPKLALGRPGVEDWPMSGEARDALDALVFDREVTLHYGGARRDRHGRALAHLVRAGDGLWVQRAMIEAGMARVYGFADNRALLPELLAAERAARAAGLGIWRHPRYRIRGAAGLDDAIGGFHIVEGAVHDAAIVRGRVFLNFGADWRTDFTVTIARSDRRTFESVFAAAGVGDLTALTGRRVRARGWLRERNGPQIVATHPEQIELLAPEPTQPGE